MKLLDIAHVNCHDWRKRKRKTKVQFRKQKWFWRSSVRPAHTHQVAHPHTPSMAQQPSLIYQKGPWNTNCRKVKQDISYGRASCCTLATVYICLNPNWIVQKLFATFCRNRQPWLVKSERYATSINWQKKKDTRNSLPVYSKHTSCVLKA